MQKYRYRQSVVFTMGKSSIGGRVMALSSPHKWKIERYLKNVHQWKIGRYLKNI